MGIQTEEKLENQDETTAANTDKSSIIRVFLRYQAALRNFIAKHSLPSSHIDDISQETFLRAYEAEKKHAIDQPRAFLFRIARNLILSEVTKKSHKITCYIEDFEASEVLVSGSPLETEIEAHQKVGVYCEAIAALPPRCRKVFLLKKVYGLSHKEIAHRLDISVSTIEKHIATGVRQCDKFIQSRYQQHLGITKTTTTDTNKSAVSKKAKQ